MNYYHYQSTCVRECPYLKGYAPIEQNCVQCASFNKVLYNNQCVDSCPKQTVNVNSICLGCKAAGYYNYGSLCVKECPDYFILNEETNSCVPCAQKEMFTLENKCVKECPKGYTYDKETLICMTCSEANMPNHRGKCVEKCPSGTKEKDEVCLDCNEGEFYNEKISKCVDSCDSSEFIIDETLFTCSICEDDKYIYSNSCYETCGEVNRCNDAVNKKCIYCNECQAKGKVLYNNNCYDSCPSSTKEHLGECKSCKDLSLYDVNGECQSQCLSNQIASIDNTCYECSLYLNGQCVTRCPSSYIKEGSNCVECPSNSPYIYDNKCYSECPLNTKSSYDRKCVIEDSKILTQCSNNGKYNEESKQCDCNEGYFGDICNYKGNTNELTLTIEMFDDEYITFGFDIKDGSGNYSSIWMLNEEELSMSMNPNGNKQNKFKVNTNALKSLTIIKLTVNDLDNSNKEYQSTFELTFDIPNEDDFVCDVAYYENGNKITKGTAMKSLVEIELSSKSLMNTYLYKFAYVDSEGFIITLTDYDIDNTFMSDKFSVSNKVIVYVQSLSGIIRKIQCDVDIVANSQIDTSTLLSFLKTKSSLSKGDIQQIASMLDTVALNDDLYVILRKMLLNTEIDDHQAVAKIYKSLVKFDDGSNAIEMSSVLKSMIESISSRSSSELSKDDISSYLSVIDITYEKIRNIDESLSAENNSNDVKSALSTLSTYISKKLSPNEKIKLSSKNIISYIAKTSPSTKKYTIPDESSSSSSYENVDPSSDSIEGECDNSELFCLGTSSLNKLSIYANSKVRRLDSISSMNDVSVYVARLSRNTSESQISDSSVYVKIQNADSLYIPPVDYSVSTSANITLSENSTCVDLTRVNINTLTCKTYFNYTSGRMICKCTGEADITDVMNYTLSVFTKLMQFPEPEVGMFNGLSLSIIFVTLSIIIVFSIILNIIDLIDDRQLLKMNDKNDVTIIKKEFKSLSAFNGIGILGFASFITMYSYPFFGVFVLYKFDQPRFLRFLIEIIYILLNMIFTLFPYYKVDFEDKIKFVDSRDIDTIGFSIEDLPCKIITMIQTIIYSIFSAVIITILMTIFLTILQWNKFLEKVWKKKKKRIELFIRAYMIKPLFAAKPQVVKKFTNRMMALSIFENRLYERKTLFTDKKKKKEENKEIEMTAYNSEGTIAVNSNNDLKEGLTENVVIKDNSMITMSDIEMKEDENLLVKNKITNKKLKMISGTKLSLNIADDKVGKGKKKTKIQLFYYLNQSKYLKVFFNFQKKEIKCGYTNLTLREAHPDSIEYLSKKRNLITEKGLKHDRYKLLKYAFLIVMTFAIYTGIFYFFVIIAYNVYSNYHFYIVKAWLMPCLLQLFVVGVLIEFGMDLFYGIMCYKFYQKRKSGLIMKGLFLLVSKEKIYMYKIRNYITKYSNKLNLDKE